MKIATFSADVKTLSFMGWSLIAVLYLASLGLLILQMMWYYNHPILYWVYVFLHLLVFLLGLYVVTTATGWHMFLIAFILSFILGFIPYDMIFPFLAETILNPETRGDNFSGLAKDMPQGLQSVVEFLFFPTAHFVILCLGGVVLRWFMKT